MSTGVRVGIDYGTAVTVAVLRWAGGGWRPLVFDAGPLLPSAVFVAEDGMVTGAAALPRGLTDPERLIREPLRSVTDGRVTVGSTSVDTVDLFAATLRRVREAAQTVAGGPVEQVRMVVPAWWGPRHRTSLREAARRAGLGQPTLVNTAIAVTSRLIDDAALVVPVGSWVGVVDVGTGCEASGVRRTPDGLDVVAAIHRNAGGRRLDPTLAAYLAELSATPAESDTRSATPTTP